MEYIILRASNFVHLEHVVNEYIKQGWRPQGGVTHYNEGTNYCQAMVREK
jgi:hypothetical protein